MKNIFSIRAALANVSMVLVFAMTSVTAVAKTDTNFWLESDEASEFRVDHSAWQAILDAYLVDNHPSGVNRFDYAEVSGDDKEALLDYIDVLQDIDPSTLAKNEQLAYWINFYNAGTIRVILEHYPVKSIRNIRPELFALSLGPWDHAYFSVAGEDLTLNDIEHQILRPIWKDARLHFVLNCASIGCPNLSKSSFTAANTEAQLESATEAFLEHPRAVSLKGDTLLLSSLFDWYASDFGSNQVEILDFIQRYSDLDQLDSDLENVELKFHYDWDLNSK